MIWRSRQPSGAPVVIDLARGVRESSLAAGLADLIRRNTDADPTKRAEFAAMRGAIVFIADDEGEAFTLRFDFGRLVVHDGLIGVPDVTVRGKASSIRDLADLPFLSWLGGGSSVLVRPERRAAVRASLSALSAGDLKFYGGFLHFRLVLALLRVVSKHASTIGAF